MPEALIVAELNVSAFSVASDVNGFDEPSSSYKVRYVMLSYLTTLVLPITSLQVKKGEKKDSNLQPLKPQSSALPIELHSPQKTIHP